MNPSNHSKQYGFTLIEVLIALAIVSIALMAVLKTGSQNIKNTFYIQEKTIALWVATDVMNKVRMGIIKTPEAPDKLTEKKDILNQQWEYEVGLKKTPNPHIKEIQVDVYLPNTTTQLIHLAGYLHEQ